MFVLLHVSCILILLRDVVLGLILKIRVGQLNKILRQLREMLQILRFLTQYWMFAVTLSLCCLTYTKFVVCVCVYAWTKIYTKNIYKSTLCTYGVCTFSNYMFILYSNFNCTEDCTYRITTYCSRLIMEPFKNCIRMSSILMRLTCAKTYWRRWCRRRVNIHILNFLHIIWAPMITTIKFTGYLYKKTSITRYKNIIWTCRHFTYRKRTGSDTQINYPFQHYWTVFMKNK
jgi:hypothetical protein